MRISNNLDDTAQTNPKMQVMKIRLRAGLVDKLVRHAYYLAMTDEIAYHILGPENMQLVNGADVFDNPVDPVQLAAFVADAGHELVFATARGRVVGMASGVFLLHPDKQPAFFINEVGVNEEMRNSGIGTALSEMLMNIARTKGAKGIWLATEPDNIEARALYRKLDARETAGVVVYDWDGALDD